MARYFNDDLYHSLENTEEEIVHYGVLGMKWGIRRYQPYSYTGGSGREIGKAARLQKKSNKLANKIKVLDKKRTNRFRLGTNARYRGQMSDREEKVIRKKEKIDKKLNDYVGSDAQKKELKRIDKKNAYKNINKAQTVLRNSAKDVIKLNDKSKNEKLSDKDKKLLEYNTKVAKDALKELLRAKKAVGDAEFNKNVGWVKKNELVNDVMFSLIGGPPIAGINLIGRGYDSVSDAKVISYLKSNNIKDPEIIRLFTGVFGAPKRISEEIDYNYGLNKKKKRG